MFVPAAPNAVLRSRLLTSLQEIGSPRVAWQNAKQSNLLGREISLSEKLDLLASQNSHLAALGLAVGEFVRIK